MIQYSLLIILLLISTLGSAQKPQKQIDLSILEIDEYLSATVELHEIPGLAIAVIKGGEIIYEKYHGKACLEEDVPVERNTIFGTYSTTKLISTTGVFQLIEQNKLLLSDKISSYLGNLPLAWQGITIQNLLTHSSGLPDIIRFEDISKDLSDKEKMQKLYIKSVEFQPGTRFSYNQTNYWLLTQIIEKITGLAFEEFILKNQFPSSTNGIIFSSNSSEYVPRRACKYIYDYKANKYQKSSIDNGVWAHSGNGLNITLSEFINWNNRLDNDSLLLQETKEVMWTPFAYQDSAVIFLNGWGSYGTSKSRSFGFSGGNVSAFRKFPDQDITIILLTNGYRYLPVQDQIVSRVAGIVNNELVNVSAVNEERIINSFLKDDFKEAQRVYSGIKKSSPKLSYESTLNSIGYVFLRSNKVKEAVKVFELNTKENPLSANTFDSLAESYYIIGKLELSMKNYKKSLQLNPHNSNAAAMIKKIEEIVANR